MVEKTPHLILNKLTNCIYIYSTNINYILQITTEKKTH